MPETGLTDDIIGVRETNEGTMRVECGQDHELGNDSIIDLETSISSMKLTMEAQDLRIAKLEFELERLEMNGCKGTLSNGSVIRSIAFVPTSGAVTDTYMGHDNKLDLWGSAFASLMISCMKRYMQVTGESWDNIEKIALMETYSTIMDDLYYKVRSEDLPTVHSHESLLQKVFQRKNDDEFPESRPSTWIEMSKNTDGKACMSVIESIVTAAKMVPEAMIYPISRLVMAMEQPVVAQSSKGPAFAIPSDTKIGIAPSGIEKFCWCLKKDSLKDYLRQAQAQRRQ